MQFLHRTLVTRAPMRATTTIARVCVGADPLPPIDQKTADLLVAQGMAQQETKNRLELLWLGPLLLTVGFLIGRFSTFLK